MEALVAETQAVSMPLRVVKILPLLLPEEMHGLQPPPMTGLRYLQLPQSEEEVRTAGRCCIVHHPRAMAIAGVSLRTYLPARYENDVKDTRA